MAGPTIRGLPVYLNGKKGATINKWSLKINPRREPQFGADFVAHTKGLVSFELQVTEITPVSGSALTTLNKKILNQEDVDVSVPVGTQLIKVTCAATGLGFESEAEGGKMTGEATFSGGLPTVQG